MNPPRAGDDRSNRLLRWVRAVEDGLLIALLTAMIGLAVGQILLRNLFGLSIVWGDVLVRILVLWIGLIGAMIACRTSGHIRIDLLNRYLPERLRPWTDLVVHLATAGISALAAFHGARFIGMEVRYGGTAFAGVPAYVCEAIIPVAFGVIALRYLMQSIASLQAIRRRSWRLTGGDD